jgi:hypothetical protein
VALVAASAAECKVTHQSANGFAVSHSSEVEAKPAVIWARLAHPEDWWNKSHSWSGDAANLSLSLKKGGCFCERLKGSGFVEHARLIHLAPPKMLRLSGALGPLQGEALVGTLTVTIAAIDAKRSRISFDYVVGGFARFPLDSIAPAVDGVIGEQHQRLVRLVTSGKAE